MSISLPILHFGERCLCSTRGESMAHFQDRRSGEERRQYNGEERRKHIDRRNNRKENLEFIERARLKAWMTMTDKHAED